MAKINLWSAMLDVCSLSKRAGREAPTTPDAEAVTAAAGEGSLFHQQEIELEVASGGWRIYIRGTDGDGQVELYVGRRGDIRVERRMPLRDITDVRCVSF